MRSGPAGRGAIQPLDIAPPKQIAGGPRRRGKPAFTDRASQPARIPSDEQRRLGDAERVAGLIKVAVVSEIAVIDRPGLVHLKARRPAGTWSGEASGGRAGVVRAAALHITEHLVRPGDPREMATSVRVVRVDVRVQLMGKRPKCLPDLRPSRIRFHPKGGIVIAPAGHPGMMAP